MSQARNVCLGAFLALAGAAPALGWGEPGHEIINGAAAELMESPLAPLFQANEGALAHLATIPDVKWKGNATYDQEAPMHFFQWDNYQKSALGSTIDQVVYSKLVASLGQAYVKTNGSSIWRVDQIYVLLVKALQQKNWTKALQMAGTLGHYVGDLSQPMHDTSDYDGQSIGQRGIHAYFETTLVAKLDQGALKDSVINAGGPLRQQVDDVIAESSATGDQLVRTLVFAEGKEAYAELPALLADFPNGGSDDQALEALFPPRMGAGAATLAAIWDLAAAEAGLKTTPASKLKVDDPAWFALQDPAQ